MDSFEIVDLYILFIIFFFVLKHTVSHSKLQFWAHANSITIFSPSCTLFCLCECVCGSCRVALCCIVSPLVLFNEHVLILPILFSSMFVMSNHRQLPCILWLLLLLQTRYRNLILLDQYCIEVDLSMENVQKCCSHHEYNAPRHCVNYHANGLVYMHIHMYRECEIQMKW